MDARLIEEPYAAEALGDEASGSATLRRAVEQTRRHLAPWPEAPLRDRDNRPATVQPGEKPATAVVLWRSTCSWTAKLATELSDLRGQEGSAFSPRRLDLYWVNYDEPVKRSQALATAARNGLDLEALLFSSHGEPDGPSTLDEILEVTGSPHLVLIDRDGYIVREWEGYPGDGLAQAMTPLLDRLAAITGVP